MSRRRPARATTRPIRIRRTRVAALLVAVAAIAAAADDSSPQWSSTAPPPSATATSIEPPRREHRRPRRDTPDPAGLDAALAAALSRASADAADDGVQLVVVSGRRSSEHQERLLQEAVAKHGSVEEAARWVATPQTSPHVSGDAVDIGSSGAAWLSRHGAAYGLCQIYANEPWHYELRREAVDDGCPPMYPDPTHDPRMR